MKRLLLLSSLLIVTLLLVNPAAAAERPTYVIAFVPVNWAGSLDQFEIEARRQGEFFVRESGIDEYADTEFRYIRRHLSGRSLSSRWLVQEVVAFGLLHEPADRYVGLTNGDLAPAGDSSVSGWTFGPGALGMVAEISDTVVTAHELGHTYGLCDEYFYPYWEEQNEEQPCPNPYPPSCPKDDRHSCEGLPAPDGRNSIMGPAGLLGGYAYNAPGLAHLHERFAEMFGEPTPPPGTPTPEPPAAVAQELAIASSALEIVREDGSSLELAPGPVFQPNWSADGAWIAFAATYDGNLDLYRVAAGGGQVERLTASPARDSHPAWLPGGERLIFVSDRGGVQALYLLDVSDGLAEPLVALPGPAGWPAVSVAGDRLAFSAAPDGDWELFAVVLDGEGLPLPDSLVRLTDSPGLDISPAWRPDGSGLAFASTRKGTPDLYYFDLGRQTDSPILSTSANEWAPAWLLDGRVVYHSYDGQGLSVQAVDADTGEKSILLTGFEVAAWPAPRPEK